MFTLRYVSLLLAVALLTTTTSCRRGQAFAGKPALGNGVRAVANGTARAKGSAFTASLTIYNETDQRVEVNRNQMALVAPDGREFYRQGGREVLWLEARKNIDVSLEFNTDAAVFKGAKGAYLRFDGLYIGNVRVDVPPMALGEPTGGAGRANPGFAASAPSQNGNSAVTAQVAVAPESSTDKPGLFRRMYNAAKRKDSGGATSTVAASTTTASSTASPPAPAPAADTSMQQYRGPRRQLRTPGLKCAAMPLKTKNVSEQMAFVTDEILLSELQQSGFEAIGPDDINALIGFEKTKEAIGCDDTSCASEMGHALGVPYLAAGNVTVVEGSVVLTLKLLDTKGPKVLARVNKVAEGGQKNLPRVIAEAVQELVERSAL